MSTISLVGSLCVYLFYQAMAFDMGALFGAEIDGIQAALKGSVFDPFFILALCGVFWILAKRLLRRDLTGFLMEGAKVLFIVVLSFFVVTNSSTALSQATLITKSISTSALTNINGQSSGGNYAADAAGLIWKSLVHDPWMTMEFGDSIPSTEEVEEFLTTPTNTKEREELVLKYQTDHQAEDPLVFNKDSGMARIGFLIVYLIPFLAKAVLYMLLAALQVGYQLMAVFYILLAPIILLLSLLPVFGLELLSNWAKKILETQIMIMIITFLIGLLLKFDSILYTLSGQYGWLIVLCMEALVAIIVAKNYKSMFSGIMGGISKMNRTVQTPATVRNDLRRTGNVVDGTADGRAVLGRGVRNLSAKTGAVWSAWRNHEWAEYPDYEERDYGRSDPGSARGRKRSSAKGHGTSGSRTTPPNDPDALPPGEAPPAPGGDGPVVPPPRPTTPGFRHAEKPGNTPDTRSHTSNPVPRPVTPSTQLNRATVTANPTSKQTQAAPRTIPRPITPQEDTTPTQRPVTTAVSPSVAVSGVAPARSAAPTIAPARSAAPTIAPTRTIPTPTGVSTAPIKLPAAHQSVPRTTNTTSRPAQSVHSPVSVSIPHNRPHTPTIPAQSGPDTPGTIKPPTVASTHQGVNPPIQRPTQESESIQRSVAPTKTAPVPPSRPDRPRITPQPTTDTPSTIERPTAPKIPDERES